MQAHLAICLSAHTKKTTWAVRRLQSLSRPNVASRRARMALKGAQLHPVWPIGYFADMFRQNATCAVRALRGLSGLSAELLEYIHVYGLNEIIH